MIEENLLPVMQTKEERLTSTSGVMALASNERKLLGAWQSTEEDRRKRLSSGMRVQRTEGQVSGREVDR